MELSLPLPLRALLIGFTVAAAVGPICLLTIRRTLAHGRRYGLVSGLGVATADASYAAIAAFGLTALTDLLVSGRLLLGVVGGALIALLGLRTMRARPNMPGDEVMPPGGLAGAFASIYALTMTNPMTILTFIAIFAGIGLVSGDASFLDATVVTVAVWVGSLVWWVGLTLIVGWARERISAGLLLWVNRISGAALVLFGLVSVALALG
jgi:threonine/homoserine/homoserine lactone efflux protein